MVIYLYVYWYIINIVVYGNIFWVKVRNRQADGFLKTKLVKYLVKYKARFSQHISMLNENTQEFGRYLKKGAW